MATCLNCTSKKARCSLQFGPNSHLSGVEQLRLISPLLICECESGWSLYHEIMNCRQHWVKKGKTTFNGRLLTQKTTFDGRLPLMEGDLWRKMTFDGRRVCRKQAIISSHSKAWYTCPQLVFELFIVFSWLGYGLPMACYRLRILNMFKTCTWLVHYLFLTCS